MSRGWESKSVESQQADRDAVTAKGPAPSAEEAERTLRLRTLQLARSRALADLAGACRPAHRAMLEAAIEALDKQIRET